ncbi:Rab GTPase-binding exocyst subunit S15 [Malassezia vespertilionis]|nr:Rab GTPase-binding exocyst subunit S15 [Malassezia vespertilionis]WFD05365.1 Rab GTPase-binding exocyst subunit S15 [Malassezia vespertilionis]
MGRKTGPHISLEAQLQQLTLLSDLESNTENVEQLGPIIKRLDVAQQQDEFLRHLRKFVRQKDEEIEVVCNENHEEFVSSVDDLLIVRSGSVSLKHRINELNQEIQSSGKTLSTKKRELIEKKKTGQNIDEAIETLQDCMNVLEMNILVEELISQGKYYSALRRLDELGNVHLKPLMHHEFARMLRDLIPDTRERIRQELTKELKGWMFDVREKSGNVGRIALETMVTRQQRWRHKSQKDPMLRMSAINSPIEQVVNERIEVDFLNNEHVQVDFKPLYQCIHIYEVLDQREKLQAHYQEDRKAQANLLLSQDLVIRKGGKELMALLEEIVGYFVVESHVMHTSPPGFRPLTEVEDLWETICERVVEMVKWGLRDCTEAKAFVESKSAVQTFIRTMESLEFNVTRLNALLMNLFTRFAQLLRNRFAVDFQQAVQEAQHQPMIVNDADELGKVFSVCWLKQDEIDALKRLPFPLSLPFSQTYPLCCMDIRNLVEQYYNFSSGFTQHHREIDGILKQSLDELLVEQISVNIRTTVEQSHNLSQIAQIIVNVEHFQLACRELEVWLANSRNPGRGGKLDLEASIHLQGTLEIAQKRIDTALFVKLDQFLDLVEYDWTPTTSRQGTQHASGYLRDLLDWLTTMMDSALVLLPPDAKAATFKSCFMHITNRLLNSVLLDKELKLINMNGLINMEMDVTYLYHHAKALHIEGMDSVFGQIRQTLAVILSESVSEYALSPLARNQKFPQAQPVKVANILEKLVKYYSQVPGEHEYANKRLRERDLVSRLIRK